MNRYYDAIEDAAKESGTFICDNENGIIDISHYFRIYQKASKSQLTEIIPVLNLTKYITCVVTYTYPRGQPPFSFFSLYMSGCFPFAIYLIVS